MTKIGYKALQTKTHHILFISLLLFLSSFIANAQKKTDSLNIATPIISKDSIPVEKSKSAIDVIIDHQATDYITEDIINKRINLYNEANVTYGDYNIKSGQIEIDYNTNIVKAKGIPDKDGKYSQLPVFKTSVEETQQDSLVFNYKSKKAIIYGLETQQEGINTLGRKTKRVNDSTIFVKDIIFTTSDPKNPDYYLHTNKAKIVPGKKIITGFTNLVIADVPTPIVFPFAYFPLTKDRAAGFIFPTYGESANQGFFLQNGGYYIPVNDFWDLQVTGDLYSNGSWGIRAQTRYKVNYKYSGNFDFNYDNLISGISGFSNFGVQKNFNLRWSHSQDSKASPNGTFSANVNLGSSQYFTQSVNESNTGQSQRNDLSSSISYSRKLTGTPFRMSASASHSQNINTEVIQFTLPSVRLDADRLYPFAPKNGVKKNMIQNIGITYGASGDNRITTTDDSFLDKNTFKNARAGILHNISASTSTKVLKYFSLSPSVSYREIWNFKRLRRRYDRSSNDIITDTINGFKTFRDYSGGASLSTTVYGLYKFKNRKLKAIRHVIRPSVSYSISPDFTSNSYEVQSDATGDNFQTFNISDGGLNTVNAGRGGSSISMSLSNSFEAKVRDPESKDGKDKKIKLLNSLNFSTSYNLRADSLNLAPISMSTGTQLFKKINLNFSSSFDPYALNTNNQRINKLNIKNGGSLFRMTRANFTASYSISSDDFKKDKKNKKEEDENATPHDLNLFGSDIRNSNAFANDTVKDSTHDKDKDEDKSSPFFTSSIPWNLSLSYSTSYNNARRQNQTTSNSLNLSGDVELSLGWKVGASSGYDFVNKGITYTNLRFSRDLNSWNMSFNWVPTGLNKTYYFFIGVKSSVLSDLKWDKQSTNRRF